MSLNCSLETISWTILVCWGPSHDLLGSTFGLSISVCLRPSWILGPCFKHPILELLQLLIRFLRIVKDKIKSNPRLLISNIAIAGDTIADTFKLSVEISAIIPNISIKVSVSLAEFTHFDTNYLISSFVKFLSMFNVFYFKI